MKCHNCSTLSSDHKFQKCLSTTCQCPCVYQIYKLKNDNLEKAANEHPHYLEIDDQDISRLPDTGHSVRNFSHVRKKEWLNNKKEDKRKKRIDISNYY